MRAANWILDYYEKGDDTVRWDLYMAYPDLRDYFDEIEGRISVYSDQDATAPGKPHHATWWSHCCRMVKR